MTNKKFREAVSKRLNELVIESAPTPQMITIFFKEHENDEYSKEELIYSAVVDWFERAVDIVDKEVCKLWEAEE